MISALRDRLEEPEAGLTLIELLVAAAMGIVLMGAVGTVMIGALRSQPKLSQSATDIRTVRFALERMTRELRNGFSVAPGSSATSVSFETYVRHTSCGSTIPLGPTEPSIKCQVRYTCEAGACKRTETPAGVPTGGTPVTMVKGLAAGTGFSYPATTYVRVTLVLPSAGGGTGTTTISDGASLRNATLTN
jgi:type II secretory pathway pseudopilin PulG